MTAKEYYKKFPLTPTFELKDIFIAFNQEALHMLEARNVTTNEEVNAIITEQNIKWNELHSMYIAKDGYSRMRRDDFRRFWINRMKEAHNDHQQ